MPSYRDELRQRIAQGDSLLCNNGGCTKPAVYWGDNGWLGLACEDCKSEFAYLPLEDLG